MGFNISLYNNTDDPKTVHKQPTLIASNITCYPTEAVDIMAPRLELDYNSSYTQANYCYIPEFNRWYFINDININTAQRMELSCAIDVLKTYETDIPNVNACVIRSESVGAPTYVVDNKLPVDPNRKELKTIILSGGFTPAYSAGDYNILVSMV